MKQVGERGGKPRPLAEAVLEVVARLDQAKASEVHQALVQSYGAGYATVRGILVKLMASGQLGRIEDRRYYIKAGGE